MVKISKRVECIIFLPALLFFFALLSQNAFGQNGSDIIISENGNCEENALNFDILMTKANEYPGLEKIILIARLGNGEKSRKYNEKRLEVVKAGISAFDRYPAEKIITAQGERVSGKGQVEVYIGGRLFAVFKVGRKENLQGRNCNN